MKFSAGYQYKNSGELFCEIISDYREHIAEVYFAFPGFASGRPDGTLNKSDALEQLGYELSEIKAMNIKLNLLINGNCYGAEAVSEKFYSEIAAVLEKLDRAGMLPEIVTTTSPFAAYAIRRLAPDVDIRASVNMRIDSLKAIDYLAESFDSFYLRRDLQRDLATVARFADHCRKLDKKLCLLANSGCLYNCPYQTFHDNLVSHDSELRRQHNNREFIPHLCWQRYKDGKNMADFLRSSWLRPEDIHKYEPYCHTMKLATRQHSHTRLVLAAYCSGRFDGNVLDLTEPCISQAFAPQILDNRLLDGVELPGSCCNRECGDCRKCEEILKKAVRSLF